MPRVPVSREPAPDDALSDTIEGYLEAIYYITEEGLPVRAAHIAEWLGVSPPSAASALQRMAAADLVEINRAREIGFTRRGRTLASEIVRRHRIAERWLVDVLKFDWLTADLEASRLEHGMSTAVADRLFELIGRPATCPHGNEIPGVRKKRPPERALSTLEAGERAPLQRISEVAEHEAPDLLRFLGDNGFTLGGEIEMVSTNRGAGTVTVNVGGRAIAMSIEVAGRVWVRA